MTIASTVSSSAAESSVSPAATGTSATNNNNNNSNNNNPAPIDILEQRLIDAEYKTWKKNTPFLYDFVITHSLEWPSLTCQWLPQTRILPHTTAQPQAVEHSLLLGTHTTDEQNYVMVATCILPYEQGPVPTNGSVAHAGHDKVTSALSPCSTTTVTNTTCTTLRYDEEKKEVGGYGLAPAQIGKIEIQMKVPHEGEVHRARTMPQNPFILATRGPAPEIYIWDLSKHPSIPTTPLLFAPQGVCVGHVGEGYGMVWNPHQVGHLATVSDDQKVMVWDVNAVLAPSYKETGTQLTATQVLSGHRNVVGDADWHPMDPHMIGSVGDDRQIILWDLRTGEGSHKVEQAHQDDIMSIAFNPKNEHVFATGSSDKTIKIWDMRNLDKPISTLLGHNDHIYQVSWAPFNESILGSCGADRRVAMWDLSRIGMEQSSEDAEDGPPELLFLHGGHTRSVSDFGWNANDPWTVASVSDENVLQIWKIAEEIYQLDEDEELSAGEGEDGLLGDDELE
jgi:histone-binding protein RBBP4